MNVIPNVPSSRRSDISNVTEHSRVFISYASDCAADAMLLVTSLEHKGIKCFIAPRDVHGGGNFAEEIVRAIANCDLVVLLLSLAARTSPHVSREVKLAIEEQRRLLPLAMPGSDHLVSMPKEWVYWLSTVQVVEFGEIDEAVNRVCETLRIDETLAGAEEPHRTSPITVGHAKLGPSRRLITRRMTPSSLLRAELESVPLIGREEEMARLEEWCAKADDFDIRLITAGPGQGKTRLALALGTRLQSMGWASVVVARDNDGQSLVDTLQQKPTLLVIDYAETRVSQTVDIVKHILKIGLPERARLLLLSRSAGDWWRGLQAMTSVEDLFELATTQVLVPLVDNPEVVMELYLSAYDVFVKSLRLAPLMPPTPPYRRFSSVLDVLSDALVAALSGMPAEGNSASGVLSHERRYISSALRADSIEGVDTIDLDRYAVVFALFGAADENAAVALLRQCAGELDSSVCRRVARVFRRLYPSSSLYIEGIRPDALAESLVAQVLETDGQLPGSMRVWEPEVISPEQLRRGLTVLARAAARNVQVARELRRLLAAADERMIEASIDVATQVEDPAVLLAGTMVAVDSNAELDPRLLLRRIPEESLNLAPVAAHLAERIFVAMRPHGQYLDIEQIQWAIACSCRFSDVGMGSLAIESNRLAVDRLDEMARSGYGNPQTLGRALTNLSNRLWETGFVRASVDPARRSVETLDGLPEGYDLVAAKSNLASRLTETGRESEARTILLDAKLSCRALFAVDSRSEGLYGSILNNLTCVHIALGDFAAANLDGLEAVSLRREQALTNRDQYLPYLARSLANAGIAVMGCGEESVAMSMVLQARALHERLVPQAPIFGFEQAESAAIYGAMLLASRRFADASDALAVSRSMLDKWASELGELAARLRRILEVLQNAAARAVYIEWADLAPQLGFQMPTLLEYRDLWSPSI